MKMEIQRIDFYVRIDPNSKRSQGEVTSSILKKKQIIIFSVRDSTKTAKAKHCFCGVRHANRYNFFFVHIIYIVCGSMYCCLSRMPASGKFSNSHCQRSANYIIRFVKIGA